MDKRIDALGNLNLFPEIPTHHTKRLVLRKIRPETYVHLLTRAKEPEARCFLNFHDELAWEKEKQKATIGYQTWNTSMVLFNLFEPETGVSIGQCGFHTWKIFHKKAELGYLLYDLNFGGRGLMQEAVAFCIEFGFKEMNLLRIEAMTSPTNLASKRILEKFGFIEEGLLQKNYIKNDQAEDSIMYGLLRSN